MKIGQGVIVLLLAGCLVSGIPLGIRLEKPIMLAGAAKWQEVPEQTTLLGTKSVSGIESKLYQFLIAKVEKTARKGGATKWVYVPDSKLVFASASEASRTFSAWNDELLNMLIVNCPYELYWFDRSMGVSFQYSTLAEGRVSVTSITYTLGVTKDYQKNGDVNTVQSPERIPVIGKALAKADEIIAANASKGDREKLIAYKNAICDLVDYDENAARTMKNSASMNPWQLISVFDGDSTTNVVCEGYAKAFAYLCEKSKWTDPDFRCQIMTGTMSGGTGAGNHMWNVVRLNGQNYLVDVTNSDAGAIGEAGDLFMPSEAITSSVAGYSFRANGALVTYQYDKSMSNIYQTSELQLGVTMEEKDTRLSIGELKIEVTQAEDGNTATAVVDWEKLAKAEGYQVQLSRDKTFKTGVIKKNMSTSKLRINNLKKGRYYVKVRAFYKKNGKTKYGSYSSAYQIAF